MKINEFEKQLKKLPEKEPPEEISDNIISYSKEKAIDMSEGSEINFHEIMKRILLKILEMIPFFEVFWYLNEKIVKKNEITIKLNRL